MQHGRRNAKARREKPVQFRLLEVEKADIVTAAQAKGLSTSAWMRCGAKGVCEGARALSRRDDPSEARKAAQRNLGRMAKQEIPACKCPDMTTWTQFRSKATAYG